MTESAIFSRYFDTPPRIIKHLNLTRGEDDFREVFIVEGDGRKLVIKHTANAFTDGPVLEATAALMESYNSLGIYCPRMVLDREGHLYHHYVENGRNIYIYAEECAPYQTYEEIQESLGETADSVLYTPDGRLCCETELLRDIGRVGRAHLDMFRRPSVYRLLEPFCPPDKTDEQTECAEMFFALLRRHLPRFSAEADELEHIFHENQAAVRAVYHDGRLPTSCFQADLNISNILLDDQYHLAGLIDFNLAGREPVLNYALRESLWMSDRDVCLPGEIDKPYYDPAAEARVFARLMGNMAVIGETYDFNEAEREAFPILLRYIYSIWYSEIGELEKIKDDPDRVLALLGFLRRQMTRRIAREDLCF